MKKFFDKRHDKSNDSKSKTQFLSSMSHEIRAPISAIVSLCRMSEETDDVYILKHYLNIIQAAASHLLPLVDDILDLSDIEFGNIEFTMATVSLRQEMDTIYKIFRHQAAEKGQNFKIDMHPDLPEYVYCDSGYMKQIIISFLNASIKHTPKNGEIILSIFLLEQKNGIYKIVFSIKDNGIRIKQSEIDKMFHPIENWETSINKSGTGLELSIAKRLVELMGGELDIISDKDLGNELKFNLWFMEANEEELKMDEAQKVNLTDKCVLIVEESQVNQIVAKDMLSEMGAEVEIVSDGITCYEKYINNPEKYDLIFMDISMPEVDGYKITEKIRASNAPNAKSIPIIAMVTAAEDSIENKNKAVDSGVSGYVTKPFKLENVRNVIGACLANSKLYI